MNHGYAARKFGIVISQLRVGESTTVWVTESTGVPKRPIRFNMHGTVMQTRSQGYRITRHGPGELNFTIEEI